MTRLLLACGVLAAFAGCASLPHGIERPHSSAVADTGATRLGRSLAQATAANPGKTGVYPLGDGRDAFAARLLLARAAERSLDVQYYILRADTTGGLFCEALWQAAERGVRVRLLLDDNNTSGMDDAIAALDAHPNIEVRLFNPYANRRWRLGEAVRDFERVNRRMHNKSFTADNQATIVGGRNVGDEYFGADTPVEFADLDVLATGAVVGDVSAAFDAYWNSESAYPVASLMPAAPPESAGQVRAAWARLNAMPEAARYVDALRTSALVRELLDGKLPLEWASARVVSDDPAKVLQSTERTELHMLPRLQAALGTPERELDLVSPYFVPAGDSVEALAALAARGVAVRVLTNSLAATDVAPVYAGYAKYRAELLRAGIRLYELKPTAPVEAVPRHSGGSSGASLHAKTFAVDRSRLFIGSFNLDPRSALLNTEIGIVIESPRLATRLSTAFDREILRDAYEVRLAEGGDIEWIERTAGGEVRHTSTPGAGVLRLLWVGFLSLLPIDWLL